MGIRRFIGSLFLLWWSMLSLDTGSKLSWIWELETPSTFSIGKCIRCSGLSKFSDERSSLRIVWRFCFDFLPSRIPFRAIWLKRCIFIEFKLMRQSFEPEKLLYLLMRIIAWCLTGFSLGCFLDWGFLSSVTFFRLTLHMAFRNWFFVPQAFEIRIGCADGLSHLFFVFSWIGFVADFIWVKDIILFSKDA